MKTGEIIINVVVWNDSLIALTNMGRIFEGRYSVNLLTPRKVIWDLIGTP